MRGPTPGASFRQYEPPFLKPLLFASIYRESSATVDAFPLQAFERRVDPGSDAQVLLVFDESAFMWRSQNLERGSEEETLVEFELWIDLEMRNLSAGGMKAIRGLATTFPPVAYLSSVRQLSIEYEDVPAVRYTAHLQSFSISVLDSGSLIVHSTE
jgi:hypothetical protein